MEHIPALLFGIPVHRMTPVELRAWIRRCLTSDRTHRVTTLNAEIALAAACDPRYASALRTSDRITVDGAGIAWALRLLGFGRWERMTGSMILDIACTIAAEEGSGVAFLVRADGLTSPPILRQRLRERWPELRHAVALVDPLAPLDDGLAHAVADATPAILFTNFGHPVQETWIAEHVDAFPSVRLAAGIGGAVDYFSGAVPMPPERVRRWGMEWLWRLWRQPRRWRRIIRAVLVFPAVLARDRLRARMPATPRMHVWAPRLRRMLRMSAWV